MSIMLSAEEEKEIRLLNEQFDNFLRHKDPKERGFRKMEARCFLTKRPCWNERKENPYLKLISGGQNLVLGANDGKKTITGATNIFTAGIDSDFKAWGCDVPGLPTESTGVEVYEMAKDGNFAEICGGFGENLDRLFFQEDQVIEFCEKYAGWLRNEEGYGTFLPFQVKIGKEVKRFVAYVDVGSDGRLDVDVDRFADDFVWYAWFRYRFVFPQL